MTISNHLGPRVTEELGHGKVEANTSLMLPAASIMLTLFL